MTKEAHADYQDSYHSFQNLVASPPSLPGFGDFERIMRKMSNLKVLQLVKEPLHPLKLLKPILKYSLPTF